MIIQLEGVDGSGKSTLAKHIADICEQRNIEYIFEPVEELIPTKPHALARLTEDELDFKLNDMALSDVVYILDRGVFSDVIYRLFDNYSSVLPLGVLVDKYRQWLRDDRAVFIYCCTPDSEKRMLERGDDNPVSINNHEVIRKIYATLFDSDGVFRGCYNRWFYDIQNDPDYKRIDMFMDIILNQAGREQIRRANNV